MRIQHQLARFLAIVIKSPQSLQTKYSMYESSPTGVQELNFSTSRLNQQLSKMIQKS